MAVTSTFISSTAFVVSFAKFSPSVTESVTLFEKLAIFAIFSVLFLTLLVISSIAAAVSSNELAAVVVLLFNLSTFFSNISELSPSLNPVLLFSISIYVAESPRELIPFANFRICSFKSFVETLASTPNVNFSSGASKAKYIQIRGIGERKQFVTPINPSVGVISDGIDYSQSTLGLNLFDVKQVEVLRGPQGTTFGANGMAGVVNVQSNEPTNDAGGRIETTIGNYNSKAVGIMINAPIIENKLLSRFSLYTMNLVFFLSRA